VTARPTAAAEPEAVASRIAHLSVIDALSVAIAMRRREVVAEAVARPELFNAEMAL
jgi:hypothetical protein